MPASKQAGISCLTHWIPACAGRLRASSAACSRRRSTTCIHAGVLSRRIQDFLSINDERKVVYLGLIGEIGGTYAGASLSRSCLGLIPGTFKIQRPIALAYPDPRAGGELAREYFFGNRRGQLFLDGAF